MQPFSVKNRGPDQKRPYISRGKKTIFKTGCFITLFFLGLFVYRPAFMTFLDQKLYDILHHSLKDRGTAQPIIVDIDDRSLEAFGQWPWPRDLLARLCTIVNQGSPRAVGMDILLSEPDRTSPIRAIRLLKEKSVIPSLPPMALPSESDLDNDRILARDLRRGPYILACKFLGEKSGSLPPDLLPLNTILVSSTPEANPFQWLPPFKGILAPLPLFIRSSRGQGFVNSLSDNDGIIRRTPLVMGFKGKFYPSLSLATLMLAMEADKIILKAGPAGLTSVSIKNLTIPVSSRGHLLLHFRKNNSDFTFLSAGDILSGKIDPAVMKDRIVFMGASASGLGEYHATPVDRYFYGVGIHATAVDNILNDNLLSRPSWAMGMECVVVLLTGMLCTLMLMYLKPRPCNLLMIGTSVLFWFMELFFLRGMQIFISMTYPFLTLFATFSLLSVIRFRLEEKRTFRRTRDMMAAQNLTLLGITSLAATRDKETGMHIRRTALFVKLLAQRLRHTPRFKSVLDEHTIEVMFKSAPMHDIGKVGVPDAVLLKPGKLTDSEFEEIQKHTEYGWHAIEEAERISGADGDTSFLKVSKEIIRCHHEKWDGTGYNQGLKGEEIPLSARIMAVADVYDALTSKRTYKESFDHAKARDIIVEGRGTQFDPDVVDAFLAEQERFEEIAIEMADN